MTLDEIKDKYTENRSYDHWADFIYDQPNWKVEHIMNEISELYADQKSSELKEQRDFYKQAYDLAMELNRTSPCDPDITDEQIQAHKEYHSFVKHNLHIINKIKDNE